MSSARVGSVTVLGCGVIGTSVGLALRRAGVRVGLYDLNTDALATAERMGAGVALACTDPRADVVVVATHPSAVVGVLRDAQLRGLGSVYTDVASTKARILADARSAGCDLSTYVPGHPMAGRELSGPAAARVDLFAGRQWALCPAPTTPRAHVGTVAEMAALCGGVPMVLAPDVHDQVVASVSHVPHLVASALAARFAGGDETVLALVGQGLRDVTRIATGAPDLWRDILEQNADPVATVLEAVAKDLAEAATALRGADLAGSGVLTDLLTRGNTGRAHIVDAWAPARAEIAA
jgi:prephenate dehydrogenase